ncbi:FAD-dependent oxidoreductase, partial [bacterium]|nr:FAD-dependent oxidoreductase [bacterium]
FDPEGTPMSMLEPEDRNDSFIEIVKGYSREQAKKEAERCLECELCEEACPANMNITNYIRSIWDDDLEESVKQIYRTNPLPNVCGRVCTHNCEEACSLRFRGEPISIRWLKRYAVDTLNYEDVKKAAASGAIKTKKKNIAIIGAGPGGLAAAYYLSLMGYDITIYEKMSLAGGITRYGIPNYRLPDEALDRDIEAITQLGVKIITNTEVGKDITIDELKNNSDYVILDTGFDEGRSVLPKDLRSSNILQAMALLPIISRGEEVMVEKKILVIGGGNVAMDIARSLSRLQRKKYGEVDVSLVCLEDRDIMPADEEEIVEALEEGIEIFPGWGNANIDLDGDKINTITVQRCTQVFDENKRFNPKFDTSKTRIFKVDEIIEAVGQAPNYKYLEKYKDEIEFQGPRVVTDENGKTKLDWLYAAGDIIKGPDVINAIETGHQIAKAIDNLGSSPF